jgi:hypothetical protein
MSKAIGKIKDLQEVFGRLTPLGPGIMSLDPVLAKMSGTTSVIMLSDGMANLGMDPVATLLPGCGIKQDYLTGIRIGSPGLRACTSQEPKFRTSSRKVNLRDNRNDSRKTKR